VTSENQDDCVSPEVDSSRLSSFSELKYVVCPGIFRKSLL